MEPRIESKDAFWVMGVLAHGEARGLDYRDIWSRQFAAVHESLVPLSRDGLIYGVFLGMGQAGEVDFLAGMAVRAGTPATGGVGLRQVPGATYAVLDATPATVGDTWGALLDQWLPGSPYQYDVPKAAFETSTRMDESAAMAVHIPIVRAGV